MPLHDWTRVDAGIFHDFHQAWIAEIRRTLNGGLLPGGYYALIDQPAGPYVPDVLTLGHTGDLGIGSPSDDAGDSADGDASAGTALAVAPPRLSVVAEMTDDVWFATRRRSISIRHRSGDRVVAFVEIASRANKDRAETVEAFVDKATDALRGGVHVLVVDPFPPGPYDSPAGLADAVWRAVSDHGFDVPAGRSVTVAAFESGGPVRAYAEPVAVGRSLPDGPLFFDRGYYVNAPLDATYASAYAGVPRRWREVIEAA